MERIEVNLPKRGHDPLRTFDQPRETGREESEHKAETERDSDNRSETVRDRTNRKPCL